jgi:peptidoglycan L-alanyl-D-glutamate endopeptidase CwlK
MTIDDVSAAVVHSIFPDVQYANIEENLKYILAELKHYNLTSMEWIAMALSTVYVETGKFKPIDEYQSHFNTLERPFDLYDNREDLGNKGRGDGAKFKGRGYVQLTGRSNYRTFGPDVGVDLEMYPEMANDPMIAAKLLALFLDSKKSKIEGALKYGNLRLARKLVNGGSHGFDRFRKSYDNALSVFNRIDRQH